ncbi:MAG: hypothetical protein NTX97_02690 [Bacteroidetes bacterium]|nr:hypothetical protein [Bacteroidota bacterium]
MKKIFVGIALLVSVLMVSCSKKNDAKPQTAASDVTTINIEYRIQSASGHVNVDYIAPNSNGELEMTHAEVNRTEETINFTYATGNVFSVSASNLVPSHSVVQVQIFVNGILQVENSTTNPSQSAVAKGNF